MPVVTSTISSGGSVLDATCEVLSIDIRKEVDRLPHAEVRIIDGDAAQRKFKASNGSFWKPGATIEIKLRYEGGQDQTVFHGVVVRHAVEVTAQGSVLIVGCKDAAVCLTAARKSAVFQKKTDDKIIKELVEAAGLECGSIPTTKPAHPEMVQYQCTPWDFILSRADAQGLLTVVESGKLSMSAMKISGKPEYKFEYGITEIYELEIEADASYQPQAVKSVAWDPKKQQPTAVSEAQNVQLSPGNLDGAKLGEAMGTGTRMLSHPVPISEDELQAWADAEMARSRMGLLRGRIVVPGIGGIKLLDVISIEGVGDRFNGDTVVTGLRHRVDARSWQTDVQFGLSPERFARKPDILDAPAAGLLPAIAGLQIGIVADFEEDPDNELRLKVIIPGVDAKKSAAVWARLATPEAGKGRGYFFRPEANDEVVVGFLNCDPRCPVILGSLFGSKNTPPEAMGELSAENEKRGIVTKKGTKIGFVDGDDASVFIETEKAKLLLDDGEEKLSLSDQHGNSITLDKDGIVIKSAKALSIEAEKAVQIKGSEVNVK